MTFRQKKVDRVVQRQKSMEAIQAEDLVNEETDQNLLGTEALTTIRHMLLSDDANCHLHPSCIAHDLPDGLAHNPTTHPCFEFHVMTYGEDESSVEGLTRLDLGLRNNSLRGRYVFFKNPL
jgi:hypothetical protein